MKKFVLFVFLVVLNCSLLIGEIRFVSHQGSNTPPYTTWETAADSIMFAINISSFGDTIYVANGIYEEIVTMIPGLSLIGAGMDSCVIDTRSLAYSGFHSVDVYDSCLIKGFHVIVSNGSNVGYGISATGNSRIIMNKVSNGIRGISLGSGPFAYKNVCTGNLYGFYNFNAIVRRNIVYLNGSDGIEIDASSPYYTPIADSNFIVINGGGGFGIQVAFGTKPTIANNTIILNDPNSIGIQTGYASDTTKIFNNLIIAERGEKAIMFFSTYVPVLIYNNYCTGNFDDRFNESYVIEASNNAVVKNNVVTNAERGIKKYPGSNAIIKYNNCWNNLNSYSGVSDTTNLSIDPMVANDDTTQGDLDFHLQMFSPLIDRGDPNILDKDGSRSDIGLYGGPFGESYQYQDLPPRVPVNFTALIDTNYILLTWNKNTEADFSHYNLFRDTTGNFQADSTTFVASIEDTFYIHIIPEGIDNLYFKLTAVDNQGNESQPSEELQVLLTGTDNREPITISNYKLYQNYPNPFNPSTRIGYRLKEGGYVKLYVYDIKGELIQTLVNQYQQGGYYEVEFNGENQRTSSPTLINHHLASGVYIYQIMVRDGHNIPIFSDIKKMVYIK